MRLSEQANTIQSREDLIALVHDLIHDLRENPNDWENRELESFLEAMARWIGDMDGYYKNRGEPVPQQPSWQVLADILQAAKIYE